MKTMAGSISRWPSSSTISVRRGARKGRRGPRPRHLPVGRAGPAAPGARPGRCAAPRSPGRPLSWSRGSRRISSSSRRYDREVVAQDDGPLPLDDHRRVAPHRAQPAAELVGVVHRGREADEADLGRREDEHLLPDPAPVGVLNEVDLVEDHRVEALEEVGPGQEHVAQDLGGHDDDRRPGAQRGVPGQEPDVVLAVGGDELAVLLVGERLEGRRVEGLAAGAQRTVDGVGRDQRLARPGRSGHEHRVAGVEGPERLVLEVVEGEGQVGLERRRPGRLLDGPRGRASTPEQLPDADGEEVEDHERDGQGEHGERVRARGEDRGDHDDDDDGPAPGRGAAGPA